MTWDDMFKSLDETLARVEIAHDAGLMPWQVEAMKAEAADLRSRWKADQANGPVATYMREALALAKARLAEVKGKRNREGRFDRRDDAYAKLVLGLGHARRDAFGVPILGPTDQDDLLDDVSDRPVESKLRRIAGVMSRNMRTRCIGTDIPVAIDAPYIASLLRKQRMRCAISGIPFRFDARVEGSYRNAFGPSLDRIVNRLGYVPGNVRVTLVSVNIGINEWGAAHYRDVARAVVAQDDFEIEERLMTGYRFSTRPFHVWEAPNFSDVGDDALIPLEDAVWLPELNQQFLPRELWQATAKGYLRSSRPTGRMIFTTHAWVREWIESSCHGPASQPVCITTKPTKSGQSGTALTRNALASARTSTKLLKAASKRT